MTPLHIFEVEMIKCIFTNKHHDANDINMTQISINYTTNCRWILLSR